MLTIFYGRENVDKEKFIFDNIDPDSRTLIIVPDQFTLEAERQLFAHFGRKGKKSFMDTEVLSMSRLGFRILSELGGSKKAFIDKYGRHMILSQITGEERENLQVFRGMEGRSSFIDMVNNFISELKQYNCGTAELAQIAAQVEEGSYAQKKLQDLHLLYSRYEEAIAGKYTDSEDYIDLFLGKISQSELIRGNVIWIYGFDSFAPKALSVIGELIGCAEYVNVVLTYSDQPEAADKDLFSLTGKVMENLHVQCRARNQACIEERIPAKYTRHDRAAAISHIEKQLYALPAQTYAGPEADCGLRLVSAANLYNEAESAASFVLELVREKGLRYKDIRVICNDQDVRGPVLKRVFREYGIDLFSDAGRDILQSPVIRYITSLLDVVIEKYRSEAVFRMLKSGFGDLNTDEICDLENYAVKYRIRGSMWKRHFVKGEKEYGLEELGRLEGLRCQAVEPVSELEKIFDAKTNRQFVESFCRYLYDRVCLPEKISAFMQSQEAQGRIDLAEETSQIWGSFTSILDQINEIAGDKTFEADAFRQLLHTGLSQVEIGIIPPTQDGLIMGTMQRSRSGPVKALIVTGANEGILPQEKPAPGLFGSEEKDLFAEKGIELCKVDSVRLTEERLGIYRNLSKPSEYLYVSYSAADEEGNLARPSSVFSKLKELFPQVPVEKDILNQNRPEPLINGGISGMRHMTGALQEACLGRELTDEWEEALSWYKENHPDKLQSVARGISFTNKQEELGKAAADALFRKDPDGALSLSPSRLERYSRCPFSHFVDYGLRPEERRIFEIAPREIGDIYHECLMALTEKLTVPGMELNHPDSPWQKITSQECRDFVEETIKEHTGTYREGLFTLGNEEKYRSVRITDICTSVCWTIVEQVRAGIIKSSRFEVPFGRGRQIKPLEVDLGGETAYIEGKIDRVDYLEADRVKIIDYKTGNETFSPYEAEVGYRLQLMLYLEASLEKSRKPAGVFYFNISEPMIDVSAKEADPGEIASKVRKNFRLNGVIVDNPQVIRSVAGDFTGYSDILPLRNGKEGITATGKEGLMSEEAFDKLRESVSAKVAEICRDLAHGRIDIHPMKNSERSACTYCRYKGICRFDTALEGCSYNII